MEAFLQACGSTGPLYLAVQDPDSPEAMPQALRQPFAILGRDPRADLRLHEGSVSRKHAYLQVIAGHVFCIDLRSRTGTHWAGEPRTFGWLRPEEPLGVGPFWIRLCRGVGAKPAQAPDDWNPQAREPEDQSLSPAVTLEFLNGESQQSRWEIDRRLTLVGASTLCKVRFHGPQVARFHASLVHTPAGLWVVDLLSAEGILVNGQRVRWTRLGDGDQLDVGGFLMHAHYDTQALAALPAPHPPANAEVFPLLPSRGHAGLPAAPDSFPPLAGPADATLRELITRFGEMQHQMFDQFHQAMMMMFQMFGSLQADQMGLIRGELNRLQQLTQELQALHAVAATRPAGAGLEPAPVEGAAPVPPPPPAAVPPISPEGWLLEETVGPTPASGGAGQGTGAPAAGTPEGQPAGATPGQAGEDPYAQVYERLVALHQERQTTWQKILRFLGNPGH
jgi:pSer/pThr/pTyr-binding forkhead associated (FHA) protein